MRQPLQALTGIRRAAFWGLFGDRTASSGEIIAHAEDGIGKG